MAFEFIDCYCACANLDQLTGQDPDHSAEEAIGRNLKADTVAGRIAV